MLQTLQNTKVAFLAAKGFEQIELTRPWQDIKNAGAEVDLISLQSGEITGVNNDVTWGDSFTVDHTVESVDADSYDALVLPGGLMNPDLLRLNEDAVQFVRDFFAQHKPVAAICHGPWTLIEAGVVSGTPGHVLSLAEDRSRERRRYLGGSFRGLRQRPGNQPYARGPG